MSQALKILVQKIGWISGYVTTLATNSGVLRKNNNLYWLSQSEQGGGEKLTKHSVFLMMCRRGQWSWFGEWLGHAALPLTSWLVGGMLPWQCCLRPRPRCHSHLLLHLVLQELQLHIKDRKHWVCVHDATVSPHRLPSLINNFQKG